MSETQHQRRMMGNLQGGLIQNSSSPKTNHGIASMGENSSYDYLHDQTLRDKTDELLLRRDSDEVSDEELDIINQLN